MRLHRTYSPIRNSTIEPPSSHPPPHEPHIACPGISIPSTVHITSPNSRSHADQPDTIPKNPRRPTATTPFRISERRCLLSGGARGVRDTAGSGRRAVRTMGAVPTELSAQSACAARNHCRFETTWAHGVAASQRRAICAQMSGGDGGGVCGLRGYGS